jgi:DNA polymerase-1
MRQLPDYLLYPDPDVYRGCRGIVLDFETTNIEKGSALVAENHLVLACWYDIAEGTHHHKWGGEYDQAELVEALNNCDYIVCHNAKFELQWLARCGYDIGSRPVYDTMVAEWVLAGNRNWGILPSLEGCLLRRGYSGKMGLVSKLIKNGVCCSLIPRPWLLKYCKRDVVLTYHLMRMQMREMKDTRLLPVVYTRCLTIPALADIETYGMHLDPEQVEKEYAAYTKELAEVMADLDELTGGINPKSNPQVAQYVYGELGFTEKCDCRGNPVRGAANVYKAFPDGLPKTDEATLLSLNPSTDEQKLFLKLKKRQAQLSAALDKNLSMFVGACREKGGMIYAQLNQCTTGTHRLSSSGRSTYYKMHDGNKGCQFHNLPNIFKKLFTARREGWYVGEADFSQLEYRAGGFLTGDTVIYHEVETGHDVHKYTASIMYNCTEEEVTYDQRRLSKPDTFKPVYGGSQGTPEQVKYYKAFQEKYCIMHKMQEHWCELVGNDKMLETDWGMRYYWPSAKVNRNGYLNVKTKVFNYPIQAFATAEIVPIGLVMFWHRIRDAEMFLINTVHDSVECEMPENEIELFAEVAVQALGEDVSVYVKSVYNMDIDIPLGVGMVVGTHWSVPSVDEETWDAISQTKQLPDYKYDDGEVTTTVT